MVVTVPICRPLRKDLTKDVEGEHDENRKVQKSYQKSRQDIKTTVISNADPKEGRKKKLSSPTLKTFFLPVRDLDKLENFRR